MTMSLLHATLLLALPLGTLVIGDRIMQKLVGRRYVTQQLRKLDDRKDRRPLNLRWTGYRTDAVERHWSVLDPKALGIERRLLKLDLLFPLLYGPALAAALSIAWANLGRPFHPAWLYLPIVAAMVADWIENSVLLSQLQRHCNGHGLQAVRIRVASAATLLKVASFAAAIVLLAGLLVPGSRSMQ